MAEREFSTLPPISSIEDGDEILVVRDGEPNRYEGALGGGGPGGTPEAFTFDLPAGQTQWPATGDFSTATDKFGKVGFSYGPTLQVEVGGRRLARGTDYEAPGGVAPITFNGDFGRIVEVDLQSYGVDAPYINTGRGAINPLDNGCKGDASFETGTSPTNDTAAMQAVLDTARRDNLVLVAPKNVRFAVGVLRADCDIETLCLGRAQAVGVTDPHGLWFPGLAGCLADGSDAFDVNPTRREIGFLDIDAAHGWSQSLLIQNCEDFAIDTLIVTKNSKNGVYVPAGTQHPLKQGGGGFGLGFLSQLDGLRGAVGFRWRLLQFDGTPIGGMTDDNSSGASMAVNVSGAPPLAMMQMGPNAYHKQYGGTYEPCQMLTEDFDGYVEAVCGYYGVGINGGCRNGRIRGRLRDNVRNVSLQNMNESIVVDVEGRDYTSVAILLDYFNRKIDLTLRDGTSKRVNGAGAIEVINSAQDVRIINGDFGSLPNPTSGATPKYAVAMGNDVERLSVVNNRFSGAWSIACLLLQSGVSSANHSTGVVPLNLGTGEYNLMPDGVTPNYGVGPLDDQSHVPSSVKEITGNRFNSLVQFNSPLIALYQIGSKKLSVGTIAGNSIISPAIGKVINTFKGSLDPIVIEAMTNNPFMQGIGEASFGLAGARILSRVGNTGDPGGGGLPVVSVGSQPAPFPAGQQVYFLDGGGLGTSDGRAFRNANGAEVTAASTFQAGTPTNAARGTGKTLNRVDKTGGSGAWSSAMPVGASVAAGTDPEAELTLREGASVGITIHDAQNSGLISAAKHAVTINGATGELFRLVQNAFFSGIEFGASKGDRLSVRYRRAENRIVITVNDRFISENDAAVVLDPAQAAWIGFPIDTVGVDVTYCGAARTAIAGLPKFTTYPTVSLSGGNVVVNLGAYTDVDSVEVVVLKGGNTINASYQKLAPGGTYPPFPTQGAGGYSARITLRNAVGGGAVYHATTKPVVLA